MTRFVERLSTSQTALTGRTRSSSMGIACTSTTRGSGWRLDDSKHLQQDDSYNWDASEPKYDRSHGVLLRPTRLGLSNRTNQGRCGSPFARRRATHTNL